jgi:hypothetical protein
MVNGRDLPSVVRRTCVDGVGDGSKAGLGLADGLGADDVVATTGVGVGVGG